MTSRQEPSLRLATMDDAETIFGWRNDPWIVSLSTNQRPVTWEEHVAWFPAMLDHARHLLFIIVDAAELEVGTTHVDRHGDDSALITIYLLRQFTGKGIGPYALNAVCACAFSEWETVRRIKAYIREDNEPSRKAFMRSGFRLHPVEDSCPAGHILMIRERERDAG